MFAMLLCDCGAMFAIQILQRLLVFYIWFISQLEFHKLMHAVNGNIDCPAKKG